MGACVVHAVVLSIAKPVYCKNVMNKDNGSNNIYRIPTLFAYVAIML